MATRSIRGFNGNILDSSRSDKVEREVKHEWEVVNEGGVEKEKEEEKCMPSNNIELKNRRS